MKLSLPFGAVSGEVKPVSASQLIAAKSFKDAVALCIKLSPVRRTQNDLAALMGINASQFHKILHKKFHLPGDKIPILEMLCGNTAVTQWLAFQHNATLKFETPEKKSIYDWKEIVPFPRQQQIESLTKGRLKAMTWEQFINKKRRTR